jgi:hypothetical protein
LNNSGYFVNKYEDDGIDEKYCQNDTAAGWVVWGSVWKSVE